MHVFSCLVGVLAGHSGGIPWVGYRLFVAQMGHPDTPPIIGAVVSMPLLAWAGLVAGLPGGLAWLPHRLPPASTHASTRGLASSINSSLCASDQADGLFLVTHCLALKT